MTASAGAWYRVGTVNVTSGQQAIVGIGTNWQNDVIAIAIGDIFTVDSKTWYEVTAVNSDTSITLDRNFEGATDAGQSYAIVRNTSGTILTRIAGQVSVQFNQKQLFLDELRTWLNSNNASEELTDSHGIKQELKTPSQMVRDHDDKLAELDEIHPFPWAMRKVEFEARRAANNKKFAASGFVHLGKHRNVSPNYTAINEGLFTEITAPNILNFGSGVGNTAVSGVSKSALPVVNINGVVTKLTSLSILNTGYQANRIKLPPAEDGTRTYDSATGVSVTHATPAIAFASENATNKVVTDRVDMWGFEFFLREINDADPFVYDKGLIQSQATSINGVATVSDNIRPITYFAWYEGDTASRGKGVNWQTASEAQRTVIASDPENNIYFDDSTGKFYQWSPRGRSFAGVGNGDWFNVESTKSSLFFESSAKFVVAQGPSNSVIPFANTGGARYVAPTNAGNALGGITDNAIFVPVAPSPSVNNECYFLVCGTVSRLNKGAYHPSFNPLGASLFEGTNQGGSFWYGNNAPNLSSKLQCFTEISVNNSTPNSGSIGNISGRPDGRFYDAIYASGAGGVCRDMRYSAWGLKTEDFAAADLAIKSGEYRGRERITFTKIMNNTDSANAQGSGVSPAGGTAGFSLGDVVFVQGMDGQYRKRTVSSISQFTIIFTENVSRAANGLIVHQRQLA
ncbi:hypothetical protein FQP85_21910, partial [Pseudoalteromonas neustonica]